MQRTWMAWIVGLSLALSPNIGRGADLPDLEGVWEVTTLIEDGELIPLATVSEKYLNDGRLTIKGQLITLHPPASSSPRTLAFVIDTKKTPNTIDIANTEKVGSKGIVMISKDSLVVCLAGPNAKDHPTSFTSTKKSDATLMMLKRVESSAKPQTPTVVVAESRSGPPGTPTPPPPPPPAVKDPKPVPPAAPATPAESTKDEEMRKKLIGTWGHQTDDLIVYTTMNSDGSTSQSVTWKRGLRNTFRENERSSGTWKVKDGVVIFTVVTSTDRDRRGQVYSFRIRTLTDSEVIGVDQSGRLHREWKLP